MNNDTNQPMKDLKSTDRFSYLLRLWCSDGQWRASLEIPETGKRIGFANLEQLFAYLMDLTEVNFKLQHSTGIERTDETGKRN
jgi:hypothetical protein